MVNIVFRILVSIRTVFWLFASALAFFLAGSFVLPANLAFFSGIDDQPLFTWLAENRDAVLTSWIYGSVGILALLAVSTIACTLEYLFTRLSRRGFVLKVSPQIMHIGVLFIMLGHLLTASSGFKQEHSVGEGAVFKVEGNIALEVAEIRIENDEDGFPATWFGTLRWRDGGTRGQPVEIRPARPSFHRGYGVWFSSVSVEEDGTALAVFRTTRDPGAPWALVGAALLCLGGFMFLVARVRASNRVLDLRDG